LNLINQLELNAFVNEIRAIFSFLTKKSIEITEEMHTLQPHYGAKLFP